MINENENDFLSLTEIAGEIGCSRSWIAKKHQERVLQDKYGLKMTFCRKLTDRGKNSITPCYHKDDLSKIADIFTSTFKKCPAQQKGLVSTKEAATILGWSPERFIAAKYSGELWAVHRIKPKEVSGTRISRCMYAIEDLEAAKERAKKPGK